MSLLSSARTYEREKTGNGQKDEPKLCRFGFFDVISVRKWRVLPAISSQSVWERVQMFDEVNRPFVAVDRETGKTSSIPLTEDTGMRGRRFPGAVAK
jgi:hypothetical protein